MNEQDEFSYKRSIGDYEGMEDMYRDLQTQVAELKAIVAMARETARLNGESTTLEFLSKVKLEGDNVPSDN